MIETPVVVSNGHETYYGKMWWESPVDDPPIVEANGKRMYLEVWRIQGWEVDTDD